MTPDTRPNRPPYCVFAATVFGIALVVFQPAGANDPRHSTSDVIIQIPPPPTRTLTGATFPPLKGVVFNVGDTVRLDRVIDDGRPPADGCLDKPGVGARYCVDPVAWPAPLNVAAGAEDAIYKGGQAVVRYDAGRSSQAQVLFPTAAFIDIVEALSARYGPPTVQEMHIREVPGATRVANTVVRWKSFNPGATAPDVLEVRAFDDLRHPHPDREHGFLWLYRAGAEPMFRHFNTIDMMVLRQRRIGQWPPKPDPGD